MKGKPREGKTLFTLTDVEGSYRLQREFKEIKQKLVTRHQVLNKESSSSRVLEKSILVSKIGSIKGKKARLVTLRPEAADFAVWLEGKKYESKMRINPATKSMRVTLDSPETKWQGTSEVKFPKGKYFCFFNQLPECLYHNYLLIQASEKKKQRFDFFIVWDGYPYIQDQLNQVGRNLFSPATLKFDGVIKNHFRYIVEVEGQIILYQLTKSFDLVKISWIAQGITVVPPGEEIADDE